MVKKQKLPTQESRLVEATERQSKLAERDAVAEALLTANEKLYDLFQHALEPAPARFVQFTWADDQLFGLKTDGTFWKAPANGDPLVWTNISV